MTRTAGELPPAYVLATDPLLRQLLNPAQPPTPGSILTDNGDQTYEVQVDDTRQNTVTAWALNGFAYAVGDVVYISTAAEAPETGIILGSKTAPATLLLQVATNQGLFHVHDGNGGFLVATHTSIDDTAQTIIPNGSGDVTRRIQILGIAYHSGGTAQSVSTGVNNNASANLMGGTGTLALAVASDGEATLQRTAGTGTFDVVALYLWQ